MVFVQLLREPRFARTDKVIAYGGMDIEIKESGLWKGKAKLSKHGSGLLRRMLYLAALRSIHLENSAFGAYYRRLVGRGLKKGSALMAVMRKMLNASKEELRKRLRLLWLGSRLQTCSSMVVPHVQHGSI